MAQAYLSGKGFNLDAELAKHSDGISIQDKIDEHTPASLKIRSLPGVLDGSRRLLLPSLCHAHIHLDKCFLLQDPKFEHLKIEKGDFEEAMNITNKAKAAFDDSDLLRRGRQLVEESIRHGVTAMRAFVELDEDVQLKCLEAGLKIKEEYKFSCFIQICAFAQLPLFSGKDDGQVCRNLMSEAAKRAGVDVVGSTPYVEEDNEKAKKNVEWTIELALTTGKALDLHLDYNVDMNQKPLVHFVIQCLKDQNWVKRSSQNITLGHCTRLSTYREDEWNSLAQELQGLPVSFVGLPTSDLFMMPPDTRGTLPVLTLIEDYNLRAAIAVNNVGNAFTPITSCDPLSIANMGVAIYSAGSVKHTDLLYEVISSRAKVVIGVEPGPSLDMTVGDPASFVLFGTKKPEWRSKKSVADVIFDPSGEGRLTIWNGALIQ